MPMPVEQLPRLSWFGRRWVRVGRAVRYPVMAALAAMIVAAAGTALATAKYDAEVNARRDVIRNDAATLAGSIDLLFAQRLALLAPIAAAPPMQERDFPRMQAYLDTIDRAEAGITGGLSWIDTAGIVRAAAGVPAPQVPVSVSDRDFVQAVLGTGRSLISSAVLPRIRAGGPSLVAAVPQRDAGGQVVGVIAAGFDLTDPKTFLPVPQSLLARAYLVDRSGQLIFAGAPVQSLEDVSSRSTVLEARERGAGLLGDAQGLDGGTGKVIGFAPAPTGGVTVFVQRPGGDVYSGPRTILMLELAALAGAAAVTIAASALIGRRFDGHALVQQRAQETLFRGERLFHDFADRMPIPAWQLATLGGPRADLVFGNASYFEAFGREAGDTIGVRYHPDDAAHVGALVNDVLAGHPGSAQVRLRGADGGYRWHLLRGEALPAPSIGVVLAAVEVDDLWHALRAKDEFLGLVSHELRTPLTQILGNADALARYGASIPAEVRAEATRTIYQQGQRLRSLIENMLALSRVERGKRSDTAEPQLLQRLVPAVVETYREQHPACRVTIDADGALAPVEVHPATVEQVLWNLLSNAEKYGRSGQTIEIAAFQDAGDIVVAVRDEGDGVGDSELEKLFEAFYRAESSAPTSGLGLGLSVCKRLIEAEGGGMHARRLPEGGMEFGFRLPALDHEEPTPA